MVDYQLDENAKTLTMEWDNRKQRGKSSLLVVILGVVWVFAVGFFIVSAWVLATGRNVGPDVLIYFALFASSLFIIVIPLRMLNRFSSERVEFSEELYRYYSIKYPWLFPTKWPLESITRFTVGHNPNAQGERETMVTLNAWRGWRRSMIAYWLSDADKYRIFQAISRYFELIGRDVPFEENYDEETFGPADRGE